MENSLEGWLVTMDKESTAELPATRPSYPASSASSSTSSSASAMEDAQVYHNLEIRATPSAVTLVATTAPSAKLPIPTASSSLASLTPASTLSPAPAPAPPQSPSPSPSSSPPLSSPSSAPGVSPSSLGSVNSGASTSVVLATVSAPSQTDVSQNGGTSMFGGGTSTFKGLNTVATASSISSIVAASGAPPIPSNILETPISSKSSSQKLTPYLIAAGSVGGFFISIIVIYLVLRCRKRTKGGRPRKPERDPRQATPPPDFSDVLSYSGSKGGHETASSARSKSVSTVSPQFSQGSPFAPPPLKVARSSFIGRERGDLVRATINRHPLATLNEHSFFRSDGNNGSQSNLSQYSQNFNEKTPATTIAPRKPSLAQQISTGAAHRAPHPPVPRHDTNPRTSPANSASPARSVCIDMDIADEIGIGLGVLPLKPHTNAAGVLEAPPQARTRSATRRPSPPNGRSRQSWRAVSQVSMDSQADGNSGMHENADPALSSLRDSVASNGTSANTILDSRASLATSVVSVPRFRSVGGWVDYQTNRVERKGSEPHDTPPAPPLPDGAEVGPAGFNATSEDVMRLGSNGSSVVTVRPWNYVAHTNSPVGSASAAEPTTTPAHRSSWETEREPRTPHPADNEDVFSDAMEHYPTTPSPPNPVQPALPIVTPPILPISSPHPIFGYGYGDDGRPSHVLPTISSSLHVNQVVPLGGVGGNGTSRPTHPPLASTNNEIAPFNHMRDRSQAKQTDLRRMDSTSTATVFRYHPGEEVRLERTSRVESVVLDETMGVGRKVSSASRGLGI